MNRDRIFLSLYIIAWVPLLVCVIAKGVLLFITKEPESSISLTIVGIVVTCTGIEILAHWNSWKFFEKIEKENSGQFFMLKSCSEDKGRPLEYFSSNILPFVTFDFFKVGDWFIFIILFLITLFMVCKSRIIIPSLTTNIFGLKIYNVVVKDMRGVERAYRALSKKPLMTLVDERVIASPLSNEYLYIK